jgi:hypothetical protein
LIFLLENGIFSRGPSLQVQLGIQIIEPSLAALSAISAIHASSNHSPVIWAVLLDQTDEMQILGGRKFGVGFVDGLGTRLPVGEPGW